jgi:hypothetical protein
VAAPDTRRQLGLAFPGVAEARRRTFSGFARRNRQPATQRVGPLGGAVVQATAGSWGRLFVDARAPVRLSLVALTLTVVAPAFVIALGDR